MRVESEEYCAAFYAWLLATGYWLACLLLAAAVDGRFEDGEKVIDVLWRLL